MWRAVLWFVRRITHKNIYCNFLQASDNLKTRIAINGFGRIGRNLFRLLLNHPTIEVVAVNDIADTKTMAHLLKYDSIHGVLQENVSGETGAIHVGTKSFSFFRKEKFQI